MNLLGHHKSIVVHLQKISPHNNQRVNLERHFHKRREIAARMARGYIDAKKYVPVASVAASASSVKQAARSVTQTAPTQTSSDSQGSSHAFLWVCIVLFILVLIGVGIYFYAKHKKRQIYIQYSQNPEEGIPKQKLGLQEKIKLAKWRIFSQEDQEKQKIVQITQRTNYHGDFIEIKFMQPMGTIHTIMANEALKEKTFSYFEVEIDDNPKGCDVQIGFCYEKEYTHSLELGKSMTSLAFHSDTGLVEHQNKELYNYKFKAVYGETLGLGWHQETGRVYLSYNGKFLNPPPKSEVKVDSDDEQSRPTIIDPKEKKEDELAKMKKITVSNSKPLSPCISTNGPVRVNLNIGGQPFRMSQKELKHGLL